MARGPSRRPLWGSRDIGLPRLLFAFVGSAVAWAVHFNLIYFLETLLCTLGRGGVTAAVAITTLALGAAAAASGVVARREWRRRREARESASSGAVKLLLAMGMWAAVLFTLLIVAEAVPPLFVTPCPPGG